MPKIKHRSSRRAPPPKDSDFDHEIKLVDHSAPAPRSSGQDESSRPTSSRETADAGPSSARPGSGIAPYSLDNGEVGAVGNGTRTGPDDERASSIPNGNGPSVQVEQPTPLHEPQGPADTGALTTSTAADSKMAKSNTKPKSPESVVDILYENQRGGFLCGIPLFSSKALGNLDPPPWTNSANHASPTDIYTAQVPDPSWEWGWSAWRINHDDEVDEDGWEYSFMFSKKFSWHKARWWNSFVRRRAWIRKRVKKDQGYLESLDPHMLNTEYFTIRSSMDLSLERSPSRGASNRGSRVSLSTGNLEPVEKPDIEHTDTLLAVLRESRIDREKIEAVDNYLEHAVDDLAGLKEAMHEVMSVFVFQASRRVLLVKLTEVYDKMAAEQNKAGKDQDKADATQKEKNLEAAIHHADEEVRRLEYWSDVKSMAEEGDSKGAADHQQGWDPSWQGVDNSGPSAPVPEHG
ncbi:hypothetical protein B0T26DRAFT_810581 [Lasiosphaeria miniovina]|uniref:Meiotically up-regulated 65 protein n=1 Tax=Lasiosphaeria miniovina TaxID=1954250 RepID=A0AA40B6V6_9PEZI|nr:uncharacterized protein B0T26DRAFT_810581 [Lasiosphaeria miniovina]KAK0728687.1 hypothetical protein B0T26DRAFT_810581 [Lasiosphaeria miniovina]